MKSPTLLSFVLPFVAAATLAAVPGHSDAQTPEPLSTPSAPLPANMPTSVLPSSMSGVRTVRGHPTSRPRAGINGPYRTPDDASLVIYDYDKDYTYPIHTLANEETHIQLADDEKVIGVYMSDTKRWILHTAVTRQDVMIEPRQAGLRNPTTIITTQRRYELEIRSSDAGEFYHRVSWHYADEDALAPGGQPSAFGIEYARSASGGPLGSGSSGATGNGLRVDLTRANFNYRVSGSAPFTPTMVFDDGRFTYFQLAHNVELPAVFVMDRDGKAEIANFIPIGNDFYEVQQMATYGVLLKRDKDEVRIINSNSNDCRLTNCEPARMRSIYGKP
ncbi:TrbG/VirB9 family P-type conjugative transfer protein [Paraburkholderia sp. HD33-4]|uniref:TrbG/VirB9 family P-type conjugative transfer protein n=1 Tax=Paraburkholderia sp. HD33-4 TaxID=2883242 RepID=UPI001F1A7033|nr:TrbG/VirB9 family P-type conjugative transfer protein [Paraburkholderia sp. HD33-4]